MGGPSDGFHIIRPTRKEGKMARTRSTKNTTAQEAMQADVASTIVRKSNKRKARSSKSSGDLQVMGVAIPTPEEMGIERDKEGRLSAKGLGCLFSGDPTTRPRARFVAGNDARLTSLLVKVEKGEASIEDVRPEALVFLAEGPTAGYQIIDGELVRVHKGPRKKSKQTVDPDAEEYEDIDED